MRRNIARRNVALIIVVALACLWPGLSQAGPAEVKQAFDKLTRRLGPTGAMIVRLQDGKVMFASHVDKLFVPASVIKIVTAYAAVKTLGPDYRFMTKVYTTGRIVGGRLEGDLIIRGGADPMMLAERLWLLADQIRRTGITGVGGIQIDNTFLKPPVELNLGFRDLHRAHSAPLSGLTVSFNTYHIMLRPGGEAGAKARVFLTPETVGVPVVNNTVTTRGRGGHVSGRWVKGRLVIRGRVGLGARPGRPRAIIAVRRPTIFAAGAIAYCLRRMGVRVAPRFSTAAVPRGAKLLLVHRSLPLSFIIAQMHRYSNNVIAELILRTMGRGTLAGGIMVVRRFLGRLGIPKTDYKITSGSGLLRGTKITPRAMVKVLRAAWLDPNIGPDFVAALAVDGRRGTMRSQAGFAGQGRLVRGKTGTLSDVRSLGGYVADKKNVYAFVFMARTSMGRTTALRLMGDVLAALGRKPTNRIHP